MGIQPGGEVVLVFFSASAAARVVAGLPAAARALREAALAGADRCTIAVPGGWTPRPCASAELDRLAADTPYAVVDTAALAGGGEPQVMVQGERLVTADRLRAALAGDVGTSGPVLLAPPRDWKRLPQLSAADVDAGLQRTSRAVLAATAKPGDGIVSQLINRPISRAITRPLLRAVGISPFVATAFAAALAAAMLLLLVFGGPHGLLLGAALFQLASIVDGVDGEIARATFRGTTTGALADSLVDAVTNVSFIAGVAANLWAQGNVRAALGGAAGLAIFAAGLFLVGGREGKSAGSFSFDSIKERVRRRPSLLSQMLIWLTMRDFIALAWLVVIFAGAAAGGLFVFSLIAAGWLAVVVFMLRPRAV